MRRTDMSEAVCPVARSLDVVGDGWSLLLVRDAFLGLRRFGEFQRSLGLARNILAARLRALVEAGVFAQVPAADGSAYREYALTDKGRALLPVLDAFRAWGTAHCPRPPAATSARAAGAAGAKAAGVSGRRPRRRPGPDA